MNAEKRFAEFCQDCWKILVRRCCQRGAADNHCTLGGDIFST